MPGYPIDWEDGQSDRALPSKTCPYTKEEIERYLHGCHYHWSRDEPVTEFRASGPLLSRDHVGRRYWVFSATDGLERTWFVIVGSGQSPFDPGKTMWRWMYAGTNELNESPDAYLEHAIQEQVLHDLRDH